MSARESVLNIRIQDVVRVLPRDQAKDVALYDTMIDKSLTDLEYGTFFVPDSQPHYGREPRKDYKENGRTIVSAMAWADLEVAERFDFRSLNPRTMMRLGRSVMESAQTMTKLTNGFLDQTELTSGIQTKPEMFLPLSQGVTGLHYVLLGSIEAVEDELAVSNHKSAFSALTHEVVKPLAFTSAMRKKSRMY